MLVIEIDGSSHGTPEAQEYDAVRDEYFRSWGFRVVRFTNQQVLREPNVVRRTIAEMLTSDPSP